MAYVVKARHPHFLAGSVRIAEGQLRTVTDAEGERLITEPCPPYNEPVYVLLRKEADAPAPVTVDSPPGAADANPTQPDVVSGDAAADPVAQPALPPLQPAEAPQEASQPSAGAEAGTQPAAGATAATVAPKAVNSKRNK